MSDLLPCPFCGEVPSIMSAGMAGQPRWQHPVNDTCPIAGHYLGGWDFPEQWNRRALPAVQPDAAAIREALEAAESWLERWAVHVGNCAGGRVCTCGLTLVQYETGAALKGETL